jgi:hypothetical protein
LGPETVFILPSLISVIRVLDANTINYYSLMKWIWLIIYEDQFTSILKLTYKLKQAHPSPDYPMQHNILLSPQSIYYNRSKLLKNHSKRRKYSRVDEEKKKRGSAAGEEVTGNNHIGG